MKQHTIFQNSLQKFISNEELQPMIELVGYEDTARKLTVKTLIQYLVTAAVSVWKSLRMSRSEKRHRIVFFKDNDGHEIRVVTAYTTCPLKQSPTCIKRVGELNLFFAGLNKI